MIEWQDLHAQHNSLLSSMPSSTLRKLRDFYMAQLALVQELSEAKPLGICKTSSSIKRIEEFESLIDGKSSKERLL